VPGDDWDHARRIAGRLAYALALPLAGLAMLVAYPFWAGYRAIAKRVGGPAPGYATSACSSPH
jgi:hypothetical protein